jgi:drug/metabolite transporter (DMT)-like permease
MSAADIARLLALGALWGGSFAFMRVAVHVLGPVWLAASRVALAFLALYLLALARRNVPALREHWRDYLVIGIINTVLPFVLFSYAAQHVAASTAAILNATSPFFATIIAALWLGDRVTSAKIVGMVLGLAGVVLLVGWQSEPMHAGQWVAVFACLSAALCYGVGSIYAKVRLTGLPSFAIALYSQLAAMIVLVPTLPFVPPPGAITPLVAANVLALAVASTAIAYLLYFKLIATIGPARALTVTFLIPLFGVLWGFLFLDEKIGVNTLAACALIVCGTWLAVRQAPPAHRGFDIDLTVDQTNSAAGPRICSRNSR